MTIKRRLRTRRSRRNAVNIAKAACRAATFRYALVEPGAVAREVARFFPGAELLAYDWHDWVGDPFARGTWVATPLGAERAIAAATWRSTGPLAFASSDISPEGAGWFDAAIISGLQAADELTSFLSRH